MSSKKIQRTSYCKIHFSTRLFSKMFNVLKTCDSSCISHWYHIELSKNFCQLFISALTTGAGTMCAQCLGAGLYDRAEQVMKASMKISLALAAAIIVVAEILAPQLAMIFTPDPAVQHWAVINLRIEIVCQLFYARMFSYNTLGTGSGHTVFIMWNSFLNCIVVRLLLAVVLEYVMGLYGLGIYGVYIACGVAVASSVPVGRWFYRSKRWMNLKGAS